MKTGIAIASALLLTLVAYPTQGQHRAEARKDADATRLYPVGEAVRSSAATKQHTPNGALRPGFDANVVPRSDDGSVGPVELGFSMDLFGAATSAVYLNTNGNVTLQAPTRAFTPVPLAEIDQAMIAPFLADVDTRLGGAAPEERGIITYGRSTVDGRPAFGVTWMDVDYYAAIAHPPDKLNRFQLVIIDRSDVGVGHVDLEFNYEHIRWETGDASGGEGGLGGQSARVGYTNGADVAFELQGSGAPGTLLDANASSGLIHNRLDSDERGRYRFAIRDRAVLPELTDPPQVRQPFPVPVVTPGAGPASDGQLFYRRGGTAPYEQVALQQTANGRWTGTIPAAAMTERGVEFYVAFTEEGERVTFPAERPAERPVQLQVAFSALEAQGSFAPRTYRMISIPAELEDRSVASVFSDYGPPDTGSWRLLEWDAAAERYREATDIAEVRLGRAYWLVSRSGEGFSVGDGTAPAGQSTNTAAPVPITLQPGWNQIATPFAFPVTWSDIEGAEAVEAPVGFAEGAYRYDVDVLQPWQGYWVFNDTGAPVEIAVPPTEASDEGATASKNARNDDVPFAETPDYALQLIATLDGEDVPPDRHNYVGWAREAEERMRAEAPPVGEHVRLSVIDDGTRLASSLRPAGTEGQMWTLEIAAEVDEPFVRRKTVTVALRDRGTRPADYVIRLTDRDTGDPIPVHDDQFTVSLSPDRPTRALQLRVGPPDFIENGTQPRTTALGSAYPNPARGSVWIDYEVAETGRVEMGVYDVLGRRVQTLVEKRQSAGRHTARWDGRHAGGAPVASGVYVIRMQAKPVVAARRIVIVR